MRTKLVEHDIIECVLGLGPNLFYNSPMEACVLICRMRKPAERQGKVLFINAVNAVTRERAQSFLEAHHIQRITAAYRTFAAEEGFAHVATLDEIQANKANLNIALYVRPIKNGNGPSQAAKPLAAVIAEWEQSSRELRATMDDLFVTLEQAGLKDLTGLEDL